MANITDLKDGVNTKTRDLVLLSIATMGIYLILWLYKNCSIIETITKNKIASNTYIIWIAVCLGLMSAFGNIAELVFVSLGLEIAYGVLIIVWAFKAKKVIQEYALNEHKIYLRMNAFYTVIFNIFYINYCINDLSEAKRKQEILSTKNVDNSTN